MFSIKGNVHADGGWSLRVSVPNGQTVHHADVVRLLALGLEFFSRSPQERVLTVAEEAALEAERAEASRLPEGWEASNDGVSVALALETGRQSHSLPFHRKADGASCVAPVNGDRSFLPETRAALVAFDAEHPVGSLPAES